MLDYVNAELIEQTVVSDLNFMESEVLEKQDAIHDREKNLEIALSLGNNYHRQCEITFETMDGIKRTDTTIWALTDHNVILSGGNFIPICCIREVRIL